MLQVQLQQYTTGWTTQSAKQGKHTGNKIKRKRREDGGAMCNAMTITSALVRKNPEII